MPAAVLPCAVGKPPSWLAGLASRALWMLFQTLLPDRSWFAEESSELFL